MNDLRGLVFSPLLNVIAACAARKIVRNECAADIWEATSRTALNRYLKKSHNILLNCLALNADLGFN
jgi:hypothetical protein